MGWLATLGTSILNSSTRVDTTPAQIIDHENRPKGVTGDQIALIATGAFVLVGTGLLAAMIFRAK